MVSTITDILYFLIFPNILFYYYSRCFNLEFKWHWSFIYTILSYSMSMCEITNILPEIVVLFLKIILLAICGNLFLKQNIAGAINISSLVISSFYLTNGFTQSVSYWIVQNLNRKYVFILEYIDTLKYILSIILFIFTFWLFFKFSVDTIKNLGNLKLFISTVPLIFISLVEQTVSTFIYGNTVIYDTDNGLIFPSVNNINLILLHIFAYIGMWSTLIAFQKIVESIQNQHNIELLEIQTQEQQTYIHEAQARYQQTRAFRHDIKNHFVVLKQLLSNGDIEKANIYLSNLDEIAVNICCPIHTKNAVVDVLLGSKLIVAKQKQINTEWEIEIPTNCQIENIDWCIILANAVDNAIEANNDVDISKRYINIYSKLKGNIFLIHIENSCKSVGRKPVYGIGLSNISNVVHKYNGQMDIESKDEIFKLDILLIISQQ